MLSVSSLITTIIYRAKLTIKLCEHAQQLIYNMLVNWLMMVEKSLSGSIPEEELDLD